MATLVQIAEKGGRFAGGRSCVLNGDQTLRVSKRELVLHRLEMVIATLSGRSLHSSSRA